MDISRTEKKTFEPRETKTFEPINSSQSGKNAQQARDNLARYQDEESHFCCLVDCFLNCWKSIKAFFCYLFSISKE